MAVSLDIVSVCPGIHMLGGFQFIWANLEIASYKSIIYNRKKIVIDRQKMIVHFWFV